jgi:hypothetical protein
VLLALGWLGGRVTHQGGVEKYWLWLQKQTPLNSKKNQALSLTGKVRCTLRTKREGMVLQFALTINFNFNILLPSTLSERITSYRTMIRDNTAQYGTNIFFVTAIRLNQFIGCFAITPYLVTIVLSPAGRSNIFMRCHLSPPTNKDLDIIKIYI